jgi:hypothetical protein
LEKYAVELEAKWRAGLIEVREGTPSGTLCTFDKMVSEEPGSGAAVVEEAEPEQSAQPIEEEEAAPTADVAEKPSRSWTKNQLVDWIVETLGPEDFTREELAALRKKDLLEIAT